MEALLASAATPRPGASPGAPGAVSPRIRDAAVEFEAVFLTSMLEPMFETVGEDAFGGGAGASTYRSLLVENYAQSIAQAGGIGLADIVQREMIALQEASQDQQ